MSESSIERGDQNIVAPDESFRIHDIAKSRVMAEASDTPHTNARIDRAEQARREKRETPLQDYTRDVAAELVAHETQAENSERFAGQQYEANKLVEAVGEHIGVESVYNFEQRAIETKRDTEALQRTLDRLFDQPGREQDIQSLQRVLVEAQDRQATQEYALIKLRTKAVGQDGKDHYFMDDYIAYKKSLLPQEKE